MQRSYKLIRNLIPKVDAEVLEYSEEDPKHGYEFYGPGGLLFLTHAIILKIPRTAAEYEIQFLNVTKEQKELLFTLLNAELHCKNKQIERSINV